MFWKSKITAKDKESVLVPLREMGDAFRMMAAGSPKIEIKTLSQSERWMYDEIVRQAHEAVRKLGASTH